MAVGQLAYAGEIILTPEERKSLMRRWGSVVDRVLKNIQGMISFGSREIWLSQDLHPTRKRFVNAHEIGHHILPMHKELAYLDNWQTMDPNVREACEREANQVAIELLAQGDLLRRMADEASFGRHTVDQLSGHASISLQATARRIADESHRRVCTIVYYRGSATGKLMEPHVYTSKSFEERYRWQSGKLPADEVLTAVRAAGLSYERHDIIATDVKGRSVQLACEAINTPRALIGLIADEHARIVPTSIFMR
jgi:Zn-dependent peptidase ImmA (M78 family)